MAHKFAAIWTSYLLTDKGLKENGKIDLRNMQPNGRLETGDHEFPANTHTRISGMALGVGPFFRLTLESELGDSYEGVLAQESSDGSFMIIAGKKHFSQGFEVREGKLTQDDPPWVITKP